MELFDPRKRDEPFADYRDYTEHLFACVNRRLALYIDGLMEQLSNEQGGFKSILCPDIEIARELCGRQLREFQSGRQTVQSGGAEAVSALPDDLGELLSALAGGGDAEEPEPSAEALLDYIDRRASLTETPLPLHRLCRRLDFSPLAVFCLACAVLSSVQTSYACVFQVVNQSGGQPAPSMESAARVFYGQAFSIAGAYGQMSRALEQLQPVLPLQTGGTMPFSVPLAPDKRVIDFLFGSCPEKIDGNYHRFFSRLTDGAEPEPLLAGGRVLESLTIAYDGGGRIFALSGDEGAGRKFTIRHFCRDRGLSCISVNCAKLFVCDCDFVDRALWSAARECVLTGACVCLDGLACREEERDRFFGYMDLAFGTFARRGLTVFAVSVEKLPMRQITELEFTQLEIPTPTDTERESVWAFYAGGYRLEPDVELGEMAVKFVFTPGRIKNALRQARSLAAMERSPAISRAVLFRACYGQISHKLSQKATRIQASFGWDDIVMNPDQRLALKNACDQLVYRRQVYEDWGYLQKYPYGRGLSVLLFGAPGTGKSMCAQVIAHELNLELYRVDLSRVLDKYVGETEKAISMIFREAGKCNAVLFFDECDTLFTRRSDDGGSNQSANNSKTALLLQEVETYDGVSVLATNCKHNIDPAFFRRMKFIVEFQFPDAETRKLLWITTIPKSTPLAGDVDIGFLAERFEFVGGNIKNCVLNAAFLAAADPRAGGRVHMRHYLRAVRYEFVKTGRVFTRADFEPYAGLVL